MNQVILVGNLCRDNELRYSTGDNSNASLRNTVAVQREFKNKETNKYDSDFINIVAFGKTAEFLNKYFQKGSKVGIVGHIQTGSYTNKEGQKIFTTDVVIDKVEFVSSKSDNGNNTASRPSADSFIDAGLEQDLNDSLPFK